MVQQQEVQIPRKLREAFAAVAKGRPARETKLIKGTADLETGSKRCEQS